MTPENEFFYYRELDIAFVEFLEMLCRVAEFKFKGTELDSEPLYVKVGYVIDDLLPLIGVNERNEVDPGPVEVSESDEDY